MSSRSRLLRSFLFAPGSNPVLPGKALAAGADAVICDLEDAVAPDDKQQARAAVAELVTERATAAACEVHVRINRGPDGYDADDIAAVVVPGLAAIRLPKAVRPDEVAGVAELTGELERARGMAPGSIGLYATIESAAGAEQARALASAPRVVALVFGSADFLADIGALGGDGRDATLVARSMLVLASRAAGAGPPVDGAFIDLDDTEGLRQTTAWARSLGFFGRSAIHPRQLGVIHEVFAPTAEETAWAERVVASMGGGAGTAVLDGEFIDAAVLQRARAVLALARER